jgi:hypothetical protein
MYVDPNFKSKKELKEAIDRGEDITVFAPGLGTPKENGTEYIEGPHYPKPHTWYATVIVKDGKVVKAK